MKGPILEFTTHGSPRDVSAAVEACAAERRLVNALVVPWESTPEVLSMSVTWSKADGWSIEHTNLGTVMLAALPDGGTRVTVVASSDAAEAGGRQQRSGQDPAALLTAFARQIEQRLRDASSAPEPPR